MEEQGTKRRSNGIIFLLVAIIVIMAIFLYTGLISMYRDTYTINVDKCLEKENFRKEGAYIIETLESDCIVKSKYAKGETDCLNLQVLSADNFNVDIELDYDDISVNDIGVNDTVFLHREVYYTLAGDRLYTKDKVSLPKTNTESL